MVSQERTRSPYSRRVLRSGMLAISTFAKHRNQKGVQFLLFSEPNSMTSAHCKLQNYQSIDRLLIIPLSRDSSTSRGPRDVPRTSSGYGIRNPRKGISEPEILSELNVPRESREAGLQGRWRTPTRAHPDGVGVASVYSETRTSPQPDRARGGRGGNIRWSARYESENALPTALIEMNM